MFYGQPHIETKISLFIVAFCFFAVSVMMSTISITILKKWKEISFSDIIKSNSILYGMFTSLCLVSFFLNFYILTFSRKNDFIEKIIFILLFLIFFIFQTYLFLKFWEKRIAGIFFKNYRILTIGFYFFSLIYIIGSNFPSDAADKYLLFSTKCFFEPNVKEVLLLDNSKLQIDSAITVIDSFSNKKSYREEILFAIYFNSRHRKEVSFSFKLLDSLNFIGGTANDLKFKGLYLRKLKDSIKIVVEQIDLVNKLGWDGSTKTDTIEFVKKKIQKINRQDL